MGNGGEGRGEEGEVKGREGDWCPPHMTCLHDAPECAHKALSYAQKHITRVSSNVCYLGTSSVHTVGIVTRYDVNVIFCYHSPCIRFR